MQLVLADEVHCRKLHCKAAGVKSKEEYLAKVHCLRRAYDLVFAEEERLEWFRKTGRILVTNILERAGKVRKREGVLS